MNPQTTAPRDAAAPGPRVEDWVAELADDAGPLGGGAACAMMAASAGALVEMAASFLDDPRGADVRARAASVRRAALRSVAADGAVSGALGDALRSGDGRAIHHTAIASARSALDVGEVAAALLPELDFLVEHAAGYLASELVVATEAAAAAVSGARALAAGDLHLALTHTGDHIREDLGDLETRVGRLAVVRRYLDDLRIAATSRV